MSATHEQAPPSPAPDGPPRPARPARTAAFRATGWVLVLVWAFATVAAQVVGYAGGSARDLRAGLRSGDVSRVEVDLAPWGQGDWAGPTGSSPRSVVVQWRDGWRLRRATLREYASEERAERARRRARREGVTPGEEWRSPSHVVAGPVEDWLGSFDADVVVRDLPEHPFSVGALQLPPWLFTTLLGVAVGTYALVGLNARPWRATSWAWTWMVLLVPPLGVPAYLLLGGPTGLFPPPLPHRPRLGGGWAFLLVCLVLGPVTVRLLGGA